MKCETCEGELRYYSQVRLNNKESKYVCLDCYNKVTTKAKKGLFNIEEFKKEIETINEHKKTIASYCNRMKRYSEHKKLSQDKVVSSFLRIENEKSIQEHLKVRSVLTIEEHTKILKSIMEEHLNSKVLRDISLVGTSNDNHHLNNKYLELTSILL